MGLLTGEGRATNAPIAAAAIIGQANNIAGTRSSDRSKLRSNGELAPFASFAGEVEPVTPPVVDCGTTGDDEQEARL